MKDVDLGQVCKWVFGSIAIMVATYVTKNSNCLWAFILLGLF